MSAFLFFSPQLLVQFTIYLLCGYLLIKLPELLYLIRRNFLIFLRLLQKFIVLGKDFVNLWLQNFVLQLINVFDFENLLLEHIDQRQSDEENRVPTSK